MMDNSLIHWGVPGMKWGQRRSRSGGGSKTTSPKQSHFSKSLQQKYGHTSVSSLVASVKPVAMNTAKTLVKAYVAFKVTEIAVSAIPRIAWATGTVISNSPVS